MHARATDLPCQDRDWIARARVGYDFAHAIVDDHSRLAYVELLDDERAQTVTVASSSAASRSSNATGSPPGA